jgi:predicted  nucleic acid-binding Zn-ribbon protein
MSLTTFLLRLLGKSPEQVQERERFERNMRQLDVREEELDKLLAEIREVDQTYQDKRSTLARTANSVRPMEGPDDVRIRFASEHDDVSG